MLIYDEYRAAVMSGKVELEKEDFFSEFYSKVFSHICELESGGEYDFSLLGQFFSPEEIGRLEGLMQKRRELAENGFDVFLQCAEALKKEKKLSGEDTVDDIRRLLESKRMANKK